MIDRYIQLGQSVSSTTVFTDEQGNVLYPIDPSLYPKVRVVDSIGNIIEEGIGFFDNNSNVYVFNWTCPSDAVLSQENAKWSIIWYLKDTNGKEHYIKEFFDVVSPQNLYGVEKESERILLKNTTLELTIPLEFTPDNISFKLLDNSGNVIFSDNNPQNLGYFSGLYFFRTYINENNLNLSVHNTYNGIWDIEINGKFLSYYDKITCIDVFTLSLIKNLRSILDKVMKDINNYTGYRDSELYFYLKEGLDVVNIITPITNWTFDNFKKSLPKFILLQGGEYVALKAQMLAENDTSFSYSGQPVSLEINRVDGLESEWQRVNEWLNNEFKEYKKKLINKTKGFVLGLSSPNINTGLPLDFSK